MVEKDQSLTYTECILASSCKYAIIEQQDKSLICSTQGTQFVNSVTKRCISACPDNFYQDLKQQYNSYYICYDTCPQQTIKYTNSQGKKQCTYSSDCKLTISQDQTKCNQDCKAGEIAVFENGLTYCRSSAFR
ncbi:hypothetical protein ABPG72_007091 [Tetrahymena utriculariae]